MRPYNLVYDCELMFENALVFNEPGGWIHTDAGRLRAVLRKSLAKSLVWPRLNPKPLYP